MDMLCRLQSSSDTLTSHERWGNRFLMNATFCRIIAGVPMPQNIAIHTVLISFNCRRPRHHGRDFPPKNNIRRFLEIQSGGWLLAGDNGP